MQVNAESCHSEFVVYEVVNPVAALMTCTGNVRVMNVKKLKNFNNCR